MMFKLKVSKEELKELALYIICGAVLAMPLIFSNLWLIGWVAYAPIIYNEMMRNESGEKPYKSAWKRGLAFFYGYGLTTFFWLWAIYPLDFAGFDPLSAICVIIMGWLGMPLLQGTVSAFNLVVLQFMKRNGLKKCLYPLVAACSWICFEWIQTLTWAGIPWSKLAVGQTAVLYNIQSASLFGSYFISFVMSLVSGCLALAFVNLKDNKNLIKSVFSFIAAIIIFASNFTCGAIAMKEEREYKNTMTVAAIQGNIQSVEKWNSDPMDALETHKTLVLDAGNAGADLIVLSETAIPYLITKDKFLLPYVEEMVAEAGADVLVGCLDLDDDNNLYNSIRYVTNENGFEECVYNKRKPVPFGEFMPLSDLINTVFPMLGQLNLASSDITPGNKTGVFETTHGKVGSLICFDSIYEKLAFETVRDDAELLVISTNDCWFRDSAAVYQHNSHAVLRAIENGRYAVRAANTGISSIITDRGEIVQSLDPLTEGYIIGEVKMIDNETLYTKIGNMIVLAAFIFDAVIGIAQCVVGSGNVKQVGDLGIKVALKKKKKILKDVK